VKTSALNLNQLCEAGIIDVSWAHALSPVQPQLTEIAGFLETETASGAVVLPEAHNIMRVFSMPVDSVRVLIVGQDPYPTPGHAIGLSFAVDPKVRPLPRSLANIFAELKSDIGEHLSSTGQRPASFGAEVGSYLGADLSAWTRQGVMLLNRVLTVRSGEAGSHRSFGWEAITDRAIEVLASRKAPLVAILWGKQAATLRPLLAETPIIESAHPSPLSARRGFYGSRPFTTTNSLLTEQGAAPINWSRATDKPPPLS
jgi:uracil-DNA glycosylase